MAVARRRWRNIRALYLGMGLTLMGIRSLCVFTWAVWFLFRPAADLHGHPSSYLWTCIYGFVGAMLMPILWPLGLVMWATGRATLGAIYLYPWLAYAQH